jgi:hypothetical protein
MTDTLTVIRSRHLRLAKTIHAYGRIDDYDRAKTLDLFEIPCSGLDAIGALLTRLLPQPSCAVVFGGIADPARTRGVRRLAYPDPETGELATLRPIPHRWCALDVDGIERPETVPAHDLAACAAEAIWRLPLAFHGARCIVQASAGHGIKPGCRLRLWFWLSRPTIGEELGFWLKHYPVDPCTFRPAQPIYTAAPIFVGRRDHLLFRLAERAGAVSVEVPTPASLVPPPRATVASVDRQAATENDVEAFISDALARVRSASDGAKHRTLRDMARLLGGIQSSTGFTDSEAERWLVDALPANIRDRKRAQATVEWGLEAGRAAPIAVPHRSVDRTPDPRRKATARAAFRLLQMNVPSDELLATLHDLNGRHADPLPPNVIAETALWAARQQAKDRPHAR